MKDQVKKIIPAALARMTVTYSKADLVAVALLGGLVSVWAALADGGFSVRVLLASEALFFSLYLVGSLFAGASCLARGVLFKLPLRLLVGYAVVNTALLVLAWLSPLGMVPNFGIIAALAIAMLSLVKKREEVRAHPGSLWALGLCAVATTLWCRDSLDPIIEQQGVVTFKPWIDGFYHAVHIRIFAESHGAATIEDFRMTGVPARLYHYGVYMLPAVVKQASAVHSYSVFAGVLLPVGVLFTGLAAYSLFAALFGSWPGFAAAALLLVFPDGSQQGLQNPFMSYHWLTQISPSATYGLSLLAVAWLFVLRGTLRGSRTQLVAGWCFAGVLAAYKLHYVIASALLLLLVPALFFQARLGMRRRAAWVAAACAFYATALAVGQMVPGVPVIRFDGSGIGEILHLVSSFAVPGGLRDFLEGHVGREASAFANLFWGIPYVLLAALGVVLPLLLLLLVVSKKRMPLVVWVFPCLLVVNFLAMFFGLALDFDSSTPDELSHRPVMIVYFFVVGWVGGTLGSILIASHRLQRIGPALLVGVATLLLAVPASLGEGVQLMWVMPKISPVRLPASLVRVAEYLREHGDPEDVFQDSQFDRIYAFAALSERRTFVAHTLTLMPYRGEMVATRSQAVNRLMRLDNPKLVAATARVFGIRWFIRQQGNLVRWPPAVRDAPVFEQGGFSVYDFEAMGAAARSHRP